MPSKYDLPEKRKERGAIVTIDVVVTPVGSKSRTCCSLMGAVGAPSVRRVRPANTEAHRRDKKERKW